MTPSRRVTVPRRGARRARVAGLSLIELMVALTISLVLVFGATQVYVDSRQTYEVNEAFARLQENARYAMSVIEPDIRMSNAWGLVKGATYVEGQAAPAAPSAGAPTSCGNNFAHDVLRNVAGTDNTYGFGCAAYGAGAVVSADTLVVRRASVLPSTVTSGRLLVCSTRVLARLVTDSSTCAAAPTGQVNDLVVDAYYISRDAVARTGLPTLRRKTLVAGPAFRDDEIIPGIEDLQIQFGIDPGATTGVARRYVNPGAVTDGSQIVTVRIWLLVRSEMPETGFRDTTTYEYGDRDGDNGTTTDLNAADAATRAYAPNDNFRRLLVSRTIQIRNAMGT